MASNTSPLNGLNTIALYLTGYTTKPCPGCMIPAPILSIVVTATTKPYLKLGNIINTLNKYTVNYVIYIYKLTFLYKYLLLQYIIFVSQYLIIEVQNI